MFSKPALFSHMFFQSNTCEDNWKEWWKNKKVDDWILFLHKREPQVPTRKSFSSSPGMEGAREEVWPCGQPCGEEKRAADKHSLCCSKGSFISKRAFSRGKVLSCLAFLNGSPSCVAGWGWNLSKITKIKLCLMVHFAGNTSMEQDRWPCPFGLTEQEAHSPSVIWIELQFLVPSFFIIFFFKGCVLLAKEGMLLHQLTEKLIFPL